MGYIYKITNKMNGKIYIGMTFRTVEQRMKEHFWNAYIPSSHEYNGLLGRAIRKYGKRNFQVETLEEIDDEFLAQREIDYISLYDSFNKEKGYNLTIGGEGAVKINPAEIVKMWEKNRYSTIGDLCKMIGCGRNSIKGALRKYGYSTREHYARAGIHRGTEIAQYSLDGKFIRTYPAITVAARENKISRSGISNCLTGISKTSGGYVWKYVHSDEKNKDKIRKEHVFC